MLLANGKEERCKWFEKEGGEGYGQETNDGELEAGGVWGSGSQEQGLRDSDCRAACRLGTPSLNLCLGLFVLGKTLCPRQVRFEDVLL